MPHRYLLPLTSPIFMASETINQQILHNIVTNFETDDLAKIFNINSKRFIVVERPELSQTDSSFAPMTAAGKPIEFPAFPTVPPLELLPVIKNSSLLKHETIENFHPYKWRDAFGTTISVDAENDFDAIDPDDYPEYIAETAFPEEGKKFFTHLHFVGNPKNTYSIYNCKPLRTKKTKRFASFKFSHEIDIHFNTRKNQWEVKMSSMTSMTVPDYYATTKNGLFCSTTSAKVMHKFLKEK